MTEILSKFQQLEKRNKEVIDDVVENGISIQEIQNKVISRTQQNEGIAVNRNREFMKPTRGRVAKGKVKQQPRNVTATSNRFSLLAEEQEEETVLIGDSMVKDQGEHFGLKKKRKVRSYPGANAQKIEEVVCKTKMENNRATMIIQATGNDLFLRNGTAGQTEPLVKQLENTVEMAKTKTSNGIVIGILPRLKVSHFTLSKAIGINERLKSICQQKKVTFIDLWDTFYDKRKLYKRDGIHFSEEGKRVYGNQLNHNLYNHLKNKVDREQNLPKENPLTINKGTVVDNSERSRTKTPVNQGN